MERIKNNAPESTENKLEQLSAPEKMEAMLALFGTDTAREAFVNLCKRYIDAADKAARESYAGNAAARSWAVISNPKQAIFHNQIMDTITRLATQAKIISPLQQEVLREMHNRKVTAAIIREYLSSLGLAQREEVKNEREREEGMSDTAYYHSLGNEPWRLD